MSVVTHTRDNCRSVVPVTHWTHRNTPQHTATHCNTHTRQLSFRCPYNTLKHPSTPWNTLQHTDATSVFLFFLSVVLSFQVSFRCSFFPSYLIIFFPWFVCLFPDSFSFPLFFFPPVFRFFFDSLILFLILSFFLPVMVWQITQNLFCSLLSCVNILVTKSRTKTRQFFLRM